MQNWELEVGLIYGVEYSAFDSQMQLAIQGPSGVLDPIILTVEIPSYQAGVIAFCIVFLLMAVMFSVLRSERTKSIPPLNRLGPTDVVILRNPLSSSDAPYLAVITLVVLEVALDALIVLTALQGAGSIAIGTMLALATFLAAVILAVYRSTFMDDSFTRKPRLESIAAKQLGKNAESNKDG